MRGGAVVILAALVGAWALGLAEAGGKDEKSPPPNVVQPNDPGDSQVYNIQRSRVVEKSDAPRTREPDPSDAAVDEPIGTSEEPEGDGGDSTPTGTDPTTPAEPDPSLDPGPSPTPQPPSNPPNEPEQECTDLASVPDCVLDPITGQP